jgi:hypothetical protein
VFTVHTEIRVLGIVYANASENYPHFTTLSKTILFRNNKTLRVYYFIFLKTIHYCWLLVCFQINFDVNITIIHYYTETIIECDKFMVDYTSSPLKYILQKMKIETNVYYNITVLYIIELDYEL